MIYEFGLPEYVTNQQTIIMKYSKSLSNEATKMILKHKDITDLPEQNRFTLQIINLLNCFIILSICYVISAIILFYEMINRNRICFAN